MTTETVSPFEGRRRNFHWARPEETIKSLTRHNIRAISIANDHLQDFGPAGVIETLCSCQASDLVAIGAGRDTLEADRPLLIDAEIRDQPCNAAIKRQIIIMAGVPYDERLEAKFDAYARVTHPGVSAFSGRGAVERVRRARAENAQAFIVVMPHWKREYRWASETQRSFAAAAFDAGADLIIGHGAKMLQEVEQFGRCIAVHSIGNFVFNARGSYRSTFSPGFSAAAKLIFPSRSDACPVLRLYPLLCDNRVVKFQPRFLREQDVNEFFDLYLRLGFLPEVAQLSSDEVGFFIEMSLKELIHS